MQLRDRVRAVCAAIGCLLLLGGSPGACGLSVLEEGGASFGKGEKSNLSLSDDALGLDLEEGFLKNWTKFSDGAPIPAPMAYDSDGGVMVMYSGGAAWTYNVSADIWSRKTAPNAPNAWASYLLAYDPAERLMFLHEQWNRASWTYNVTGNVWKSLNPASMPPQRFGSAMAYDPARRVFVLFGGSDGFFPFNDTWTYDLSNNSWTEMKPENAPPPRGDFSWTYDSSNGVFVLFGGWEDIRYGYFNDTWTYNLSTNSWTNRTGPASPSARARAGLAHDPASGRSVLFGGIRNSVPLGDSWTYDPGGNVWTRINPASVPSARTCALVWDPADRSMVLFGGFDGGATLHDLWLYDPAANAWTERAPKEPAPLSRSALAHDSAGGKMVLFGGLSYSSEMGETWTYNTSGRSWSRERPDSAPPGRWGHAMAFDQPGGVVVLFGGYRGSSYLGDTWTYDPVRDRWTQMSPPGAPPPRTGHAMAYDPASGGVLLYGGRDDRSHFDDTWVFNLSRNNWTRRTVDLPAARAEHAIALDRSTGELVLFGGFNRDGYLNDTWTYNGTRNAWSNRKPGNAPSPRHGLAMAYSGGCGGTVVFGGYDGSRGYLNETWVYNLRQNGWTNLTRPNGPSARAFHSMASDDSRGTLLLFGGTDHTTSLADLWMFDLHRHRDFGDYTSALLDTGGNAFFGSMRWEADVPPATSLGFQLRTANSSRDLSAAPFAGPDGTDGTFYDESGQRIGAVHNGSRLVQYRVHFWTADEDRSPRLWRVTMEYNLQHSVHITWPLGGEELTGEQNILWGADDPENEPLAYDVYLESSTRSHVLAGDLPDGTSSLKWNASAFPPGRYRVRVVARDADSSIPLVANATTGEITLPTLNHPPTLTGAPPSSIVAGEELDYGFTAGDEDGDALEFTLLEGPRGMALDATTGRLRWAPDLPDVGNHTVKVQLSDGRRGLSKQSFTITVVAPVFPPRCTIEHPSNNSRPRDFVQVSGRALAGSAPVGRVEVRIDGGNWRTAVGIENWSFQVDTGTLASGRHRIEARAFDGSLYSDPASVEIEVRKPASDVTRGHFPVQILVILVVIVLSPAVYLLVRRRSR